VSHRVVFAPAAEDQIAALFRYLAERATPDIAERYTEGIVAFCESLAHFPHRGTRRDDVRSGLRITHFRKRTVIAFDVEGGVVSILGVFYGGQDHETRLGDTDLDEDPPLDAS
jgi:plasmid stabilization system protein ParE